VKEIISPEDFGDEFYVNVATKFWEQMEAGKPNPASIMDQFTDEDEHTKVAALFVSPISHELEHDELERAINDSVLKIKKDSLERKAANAKDINELQDLMKQQKELEKVHIKL
jgi:DNA primase